MVRKTWAKVTKKIGDFILKFGPRDIIQSRSEDRGKKEHTSRILSKAEHL